ncbi:MAG: hypothetical protein H8E12_19315 [Rhodobacteraceae bacterium]|nr:hypothetical protein [Paracoccaceae bacterium]
MANRLLPFRQYDENDVINLFANDVSDAKSTTDGNGSAGVFVSIKSGGGNFSKDPITYVDRTELSASYDHTKNQYPEVQLKVTAAAVGSLAGKVVGVTLKQTLEQDENGEKLLYNPVKRDELQAVLSGQACPVATRGIFTLTSSAFDAAADGANSCVPGYAAVISPDNAGKVSGINFDSLWAFSATLGSNVPTGVEWVSQGGDVIKYTPNHVVGTWIGTGTRTSVGPSTDVAAGMYSVLKLNL